MGVAEVWTSIGPALAGAIFGSGWWCWVDAVVSSIGTVPFVHYLPGLFASLAALMFNGVRREELQDYSPFDDDGCRSRTWLFLAYVISFVSLAGSVGLLVEDALVPEKPSTWTGVAGVLQCSLVLGRVGGPIGIRFYDVYNFFPVLLRISSLIYSKKQKQSNGERTIK